MVFENAISPSSWTLPAHSSLFTGKYIFKHNASKRHQKLDKFQITLAEILKNRGYNTAGFIGGPYCKAKYGIEQGFITYKDRLDFFEHIFTFDRFSIRNLFIFLFPSLHDFIFRTDGERTAKEINRDVVKWLKRNKKSNFFVFINYFDAHTPYIRKEFLYLFTNDTREYNKVKRSLNTKRYGNVSKEDVEYMKDHYDAEIFYLDFYLGKLLNELQRLNLINNTIIIITADHGEEFYEHGGFEHFETLYEEVIHVCLLYTSPSPRD